MGIFKGIMLGLHKAMDRNERERSKQSKINREIAFQKNRLETRRAMGKLVRTRAKANQPIRKTSKSKNRLSK